LSAGFVEFYFWGLFIFSIFFIAADFVAFLGDLFFVDAFGLIFWVFF
jgi:hypothetical protein